MPSEATPTDRKPTPHHTKRIQVVVACDECRARKTKCDGLRPTCTKCANRQRRCIYAAEPDAPPMIALKRKYEALQHESAETNRLLSQLQSVSQRDAYEILDTLRTCRNVATTLRFAQVLTASARSSNQNVGRLWLTNDCNETCTASRQLCQHYFVALSQSTVSLWEMVETAKQALNPQTSNSSLDAYPPGPRGHIHTLETLSGVTDATGGHDDQQVVLSRSGPSHSDPDSSHNGPSNQVSAFPWTHIISSDQDVSEIMTIFFVRVNTYWRFLEEHTFLRSMRTKNVDELYCSKLLVNSVLACGSLFSETDGAFAISGQLLTRGEHFHTEAMRLWDLEAGRASITSLQALTILGIESCWRGMDRLGLSLIQQAGVMNRELSILYAPKGSAGAIAEYQRVRRCIASTVVHIQVSFAHALVRGPDCLTSSIEDAPPLDSVLLDTRGYWVDYPDSREPKPIRHNRLMQERRSLTLFMSQAIQLFPRGQKGSEERLDNDVQNLSNRMEFWRQTLPNDFRFTAAMPPPLYELHMEWFCIQTALYDRWFQARTADLIEGEFLESSTEEIRSKLLTFTHGSVAAISDYRRTYGYKATPAHIFHQAAIASFILLRALSPKWPKRPLDGGSTEHDFSVAEDIAAFEECMRCLLACGVQQMQPRGIARMLYHTANQLEVQLPDAVLQILHIMAETAWQASDVRHFDSCYPNLYLVGQSDMKEHDYEMDSILRRMENI